ncbi:DNA polymerase Y family protein [Shewanella sp. JM162201]|uniref:DNA polymerase Y family protein n=1 Tax=Shewanella jiangmenensis TaxID=2837387 RepID=A0ABS5V8D0_9GAMM|nr:DNA polymerase Y family protein [Shewanella jiangmenensis]MBT1445984.1 DNA polymerase Y family protein [Shewanella jiangmenensis]
MRWLGVWLPQWELDYLRHIHGFSKETPLVLYDVARAGVIKACSQAARFGVSKGQSMGSAAQLCHTLQPFRDEPSLHQAGCDWLCLHGYSFSARVVPPPASELMFERCHDVLLLESGSMAQLFGGEEAFAAAFASALSALGCQFSMAFADTPLAAGVLARAAGSSNSSNSSNSSKDNDRHRSKDNGKYQGNADNRRHNRGDSQSQNASLRQSKNASLKPTSATLAALAPCPLAFLPLPEALLMRLEGMGLDVIGALLSLPSSELGIRFGNELVLLLSRLVGKQPHPQPFYSPQEQYTQRLELLHEAESLSALVFVLGRMFTELALFLRQRQLAVSMLELVLHYRAVEHVDRQYDMQGHEIEGLKIEDLETEGSAIYPASHSRIALAYPFAEYSAEGLLALCRLQLERFSLAAPVMALTIQRCHFVPRSAAPGSALEDSHRASLSLLARLEARLGASRIKRLGARSALLPAQCVELHPMAAGKTADNGFLLQHIDGLGFACRPPWLLPTPLRIDEEKVVLLRGPERLREPWWQAAPKNDGCGDKHADAIGANIGVTSGAQIDDTSGIERGETASASISERDSEKASTRTGTRHSEGSRGKSAKRKGKNVCHQLSECAGGQSSGNACDQSCEYSGVQSLENSVVQSHKNSGESREYSVVQNREHSVVQSLGSTAERCGAARDYYLARHSDGGLCWVFRREGEPGLYLQGWF